MAPVTRSCVASILLAVALSACGTLAPGERAGDGGGSALDGPGLTASELSVGSDVDGDGVAEEGVAGTPAGGEGASNGRAGAGGSGAATTGAGGASGAGGTSLTGGAGGSASVARSTAPIKIGITYPDTAAVNAVFGVNDEVDGSLPARRLVEYINKNGGIAGRKIEATYYAADSAADSSASGQRACAKFTEDTKMDVVINTGILGDVLPACLLRAGVSMYGVDELAGDQMDQKRLPNFFRPVGMRMDRLYGGLVSVAAQAGKLKRGDVLGVVVEDCPANQRSFKNAIEPAASRLGVKVVVGTHKCVVNVVSDLGPVTNDVQREVLRFRSSGVTHVMYLSVAEAFVNAQFTQNAKQQSYAPNYLITSNSNPYTTSREDSAIAIERSALPRTFGTGLLPLKDLGFKATPAHAAQKSAQGRCAAADKTLGSQPGYPPDPFIADAFYALCDDFYVLKAVLEANGTSFRLSDMTAGYLSVMSDRKLPSARLSDGYHNANSSRIDGAGALRPFVWNQAQKAFVYTGPTIAVS